MRAKRCVVIGAGLAGLAAAYRLVENKWDVVVLEAEEDRLGGRVFTQRVPGGKPGEWNRKALVYEIGGEWIGTSHTRMLRLCKQFGLETMMHRYSFAFVEDGDVSKFYAPGMLPFSSRENAAVSKYLNAAQKLNQCELRQLDRMDWWTRVQELGFSRKSLLRRDLMDSTDFGESIRHTSGFVGMAEYAFGNRFDEMDKKIVGGNDRLIYAFAKAIRNKSGRIEEAREVERIDQADGGVRVLARSGHAYSGDACICAIPATQLHRIHWNPPLPLEQNQAARELQYARIVKTAFLFPRRFWPKFKNSGFSLFTNRASDFCFESTYRQKGEKGIICSYAIGDKADDIADEHGPNLAKWLSKDLSIALGTDLVKGEFLKCQAWQRERCIGGAYAFYRPGQWFHVRPALSRPHQRVYFAGEHLSEAWQGFMEGAVETGEAAADAL